jgi:Spy/CpxP family protein refolding chaperone
VLTHAGKVSHAHLEQHIEPMFIDFDQRRKLQEAIQADSQDEAELKALENSLENRNKNNG